MTRILFLPAYFGFPSHFIPLVKLYQRMSAGKHEVAFLLPRLSHTDIDGRVTQGFNERARYYYSPEFLAHFNLPILDLKQQFSVLGELAAYRKFLPDLIVDDSSLTTALARQVRRLPRLAIVRSGVFGDSAKPARYRHSLESVADTLRAPARSPILLPQSIDGYFEAEAHIVPATQSLEPMPGLPGDGARARAFYCGPLLLDEREEQLIFPAEKLARFFDANRGRQVAYVTFGIEASRNPHSKVWDCLRELLRRGFALVTNVPAAAGALDLSQPDRCFYATALPMHYVCARVNLVVHVCGSATYHYPILHAKPALTIGTQCRDRESVAELLCARGLSHHLPAPAETAEFFERFSAALDLYEAAAFPFDPALPVRLNAARREIEATAAQFDFDTAITTALASR